MKTLRVLSWFLLAVVLLVAGAIGYSPFYLQAHKADLEAAAADALGRPVAIDSVALGWLLHPRPGLSIALNGLRVSNPDWDTERTLGPHLLEAERVDVTWQLRALLQRQVRIDQLVIRGARLMLQKTADGRDNWQLGTSKGKGADKISLRIPTLQLIDSQITFASPTSRVRRADITRLQLDGLGAEPLVLQAELVINQTPLTVSARAGAADAPTGARWPFQIEAQSGETRVELNGSAPAPFATTGLDAKLQMQGPTLSPLGQIAGIDGLPAGPFRLDTGLSWDGETLQVSAINGSSEADVLPAPLTISDGEISVPLDGLWSLGMTGTLGDRPGTLQLTPVAKPKAGDQTAGALAIKARLAEGRFDGELRPASGDARAQLSGKLEVGTLTLADGAQDKVSAPHANGTSGPAATKTKAAGAPTWADRPLPFSALTRLDADLDLAVQALTWQRITMRGLQARAKLRDGRLQLDGVRLALPGLTLRGQARVDVGPRVPTLKLELNTDRIDLAQARSMLSEGSKLGGSILGLSLDAEASGTTPATLIHALNGTLEAKSVRLLPPAKRGQRAKAIEFTGPTLRIDSGQAVRFKTRLARASQDRSLEAVDLALTGGTLADLLPGGRSWPRIDVIAQTRIDERRLNIRGHLGPLAAIRTGRDLMLDLMVDLGLTDNAGRTEALTGALTGTLARFDGLAGSRFQAQFSGESLAALHPGLPAQPFSAQARLQGQAHQIELLDLKASSAGSDVAGQVRIGLGEPVRIDATLNADTLDLSPFLAKHTNSADALTGTQGSGAPRFGRDNRGEQALPLERLKAFDGSLELSAGRIDLGDFAIDNGRLDARIDAGHLLLSADGAQGGLSFDLELRPGQTDWRFDLHHKGKFDLGRLIKTRNQQALSSVPVALEIRMNAVGASVPKLLRTADGRIELILGAGQLDRKTSQLPFGGLVVSLLDTVNPTQLVPVRVRKDLLNLECAVLEFDIADGIATSKHGLALQTDKLNVLGGGAIKLETGEIELRFKTVKRNGVGLSLLGIADRFVVVDGTLKSPRATVDRGDLFVESAAAWATGGLSLVADQIIQRLTSFGSPCETVLRRDASDPQP
ncbi:AsmA family protein [Thiorhodococcus mannitoliphagus]|uniref:AsmA family protein n=1 Tax=Thiorhodococcus mannitoliphagus TaxID=329406 RepID=A0A6P1DV12_9GAMM|nr:AsmA family protein [Thiorhodococcus mannitoliphagus]NEX21310.1 AsmA family protein [Thiorhodococcus mannitoliphagus]